MFGYVRVRRDTLPEAFWPEYEAVYCGLCHAMGSRYGIVSRLFLNYDFAFLAMLLAPSGASGAAGRRRCALHPHKGKPACSGGEWLDLAGAEGVILSYWKLRDTMDDSGFFRSLGAGAACLNLSRGYRRAKADCPDFDAQVRELLSELRGLERAWCPSIDQTADCFARLLRAAAPQTGRADQDRAMGELLYHLGRWIYLIDAVDDLPEDRAAGRYNPVAARFPDWTEEERAYLRRILNHSLNRMGAAFQLLEPNPYHTVVENVLYSGLPGVEELVFSGAWREYQKRHRREDQ